MTHEVGSAGPHTGWKVPFNTSKGREIGSFLTVWYFLAQHFPVPKNTHLSNVLQTLPINHACHFGSCGVPRAFPNWCILLIHLLLLPLLVLEHLWILNNGGGQLSFSHDSQAFAIGGLVNVALWVLKMWVTTSAAMTSLIIKQGNHNNLMESIKCPLYHLYTRFFSVFVFSTNTKSICKIKSIQHSSC